MAVTILGIEYKSLRAAARELGLNISGSHYKKAERLGITIEEVFERELQMGDERQKSCGGYLSITHAANALGVDRRVIYRRIANHGETPDQAIEHVKQNITKKD